MFNRLTCFFSRPMVKHNRMLIDKHLEELTSLRAEGVIDEAEYRMLKVKVQTETRTGKEMP
jgi:hypothetical protein